LGSDWKLKHVTLGLFKTIKTTGQAFAKNFIEFLNEYGFGNKIITYLKDESSNTLANALKFFVKCETLGLEKNFQGTYSGHAFSKACQYATTNDKVCKN
jgi:hypothetical protein